MNAFMLCFINIYYPKLIIFFDNTKLFRCFVASCYAPKQQGNVNLFTMQKPVLVSIGFVGLALVLVGFRKNTINTTYLDTETGNMLNRLDESLSLSDFQLKTLANQIKQQEAGNALNSNQVRTWRGLISLDLEGQLGAKNALTFAKMQQIGKDLTELMQAVINTRGRALSAYCKQYSFQLTDRVYTIETNLIKLSQLL